MSTRSSAYVLLNAETGAERELMEEITRIPGIEEAYLIYGAYDIILKVEGKSLDNLKKIVSTHIRRLKNVRSTLTMIVHP